MKSALAKKRQISDEVLNILKEGARLYWTERKSQKECAEILGVDQMYYNMLVGQRYKDIYLDFSEQIMQEKRDQALRDVKISKLQAMSKMADLAEEANRRLESIIMNPRAADKTVITAIKHIHDSIGVTSKDAEAAIGGGLGDDEKARLKDTLGIVFKSLKEVNSIPALEAEILTEEDDEGLQGSEG